MNARQALCRHCGRRIETHPAARAWWHKDTKQTACDLKATPVSAWGGRA